MKEYIKPELEYVGFATEQITDVEQGTTYGVTGDDF